MISFDESWASKYVGSKPVRLTEGFNNPWPREIDKLYQSLGYIGLTGQIDPRSTMPRVDVSAFILPNLVREPTRHTDYCVRSVIDELVFMRNRSAHGGSVLVRMRDVTNYLDDTVALAIAMDQRV